MRPRVLKGLELDGNRGAARVRKIHGGWLYDDDCFGGFTCDGAGKSLAGPAGQEVSATTRRMWLQRTMAHSAFQAPGVRPFPVALGFGIGLNGQQLHDHMAKFKGYEESGRRSGWDPMERLKDQDVDGVGVEVMYTTLGMPLFGLTGPRTAIGLLPSLQRLRQGILRRVSQAALWRGPDLAGRHRRGRQGTQTLRRDGLSGRADLGRLTGGQALLSGGLRARTGRRHRNIKWRFRCMSPPARTRRPRPAVPK